MESLHHTQSNSSPDRGSPFDPSGELRRLGEYRILRRLGEGGMGAVYLAFDEKNDRQVALKVLSDQLVGNQSYIDRFYREAKSGALLNHPSIVRSLGSGQDPATRKHYLVLEFIDGTSAQALLEQFGHLSVGDAVHIALDVARALEYAHSRNIIHRDIKPDNILITRAGVSKLSDLGLAKRTDEASHLTGARQGFGTPHYMPYEQAVNARHADGRSDVYALGATLYHLLTGEVPFKGESPLDVVESKDKGEYLPASQLKAEVPHVLDQILGRMLARSPRDRYQTASELIVDLERSRLAAALPSFADPEQALRDPWVRACLATSAQPTQPDLALHPAGEAPLPAKKSTGEPPTWVVRFLSMRDGRWRRVRLTAEQITKRLGNGRLPPEAEACGDPRHGFRPLSDHPEFAAALAGARVPAPAQRRSEKPVARTVPLGKPWAGVFIAGIAIVLLSVLAIVSLLFLRSN